MASRAHHLVLRAIPAAAASARLPHLRRAVRLSCSTRITSRPGRATRARSAGWSRGRRTARSPPIAPMSMPRSSGCSNEADASQLAEVLRILEIGLNHEQQHQELMLTDILHAFSHNPIAPAYDAGRIPPAPTKSGSGLRRDSRKGCTASASTARATASTTRARRTRPICGRCGSRARWSPMRSGSISSPTAATRRRRCGSPTAGRRCRPKAGRRPAIGARSTATGTRCTLAGLRPVDPAAPVCHVSYYEADAFARWAARICRPSGVGGRGRAGLIDDAFGIVWQWTRSAYSPYPGYRAAAGALGEYNGKFMVNQMVLRGSSLATPAGHSRVELSQFLLSARALAVHRAAARRLRQLHDPDEWNGRHGRIGPTHCAFGMRRMSSASDVRAATSSPD